jgi:hypothetical protein
MLKKPELEDLIAELERLSAADQIPVHLLHYV